MSKGLYIHIPFCVKKCPYCDFYSVTDLSLAEKYTEAVIRNIRGKGICADTVYFGGGTPSLLSAEQIYRMISSAEIENGAEITMECNPNTVDPRYLSDILSAGVNRISFGVQSLDDRELKALGRIHSAEAAVNAVTEAYKAGFRNISADLMLGTAYQTAASLKNTIEALVSLPVNHVSAYMLKIEEGTPYGKSDKILSLLPDENEVADMYLETVSLLGRHGFRQYEISNFAAENTECRHNLKYWRCQEYYGIGPSAHSYIGGVRRACPESAERFISLELQEEYITEENGGSFEEKAMLSLRLTDEGLDLASVDGSRRDEILRRAAPLISAGFLRRTENRITLTPSGCLVSNEIICRLIMQP